MNKIQMNDEILNHSYGVRIEGGHTVFSVWAPLSDDVKVCIYKTARDIRRKTHAMVNQNGIWTLSLEGDFTGKFYTYLIDGYEVIDPYVHSCSGNSTKGAILDARQVNPEGFLDHKKPKPVDRLDAILYEVHVKDFSIDHGMPFKHKGKYLAFTEKGLTFEGHKIGIDHLVELGVTHVHLLPVFDFITVNDYDDDDYNWGYDPYLFNCPEGSYALKPDDPKSRILELKQLIQSIHEAGMHVVLDVVYNHTYFGGTSNFERLMPGIFHRRTDDGHYHNGSGCGNEVQTEHPFVGKFILDSLKFWLEVYQVDGFRFDLMALYDINFVKVMSDSLKAIKPDIMLYGEPWTGGPSGLDYDLQMTKGKQRDTFVSLFNDDFRNAIKGSNDGSDLGFLGGIYRKQDVYAGCFGSIKFNDDIMGFAKYAHETVNYVSSHDNLILIDKFSKADYHRPFEEKQNMSASALALVILSFGVPFIQAGTEFLRSKYGDHNSYKSSAYINRMHWSYKRDHRHVFDFVKNLIEFRHSQKVYNLDSDKDIKKVIHMYDDIEGVVRYRIESPYKSDYKSIYIAYNGTDKVKTFDVTGYKIHIDGALYYKDQCEIRDGILHLPRYASVILIKEI